MESNAFSAALVPMQSRDSLEGKSIIDQLLEDQRRLTAVEKFSRRHDRNELPHLEKVYRDLIPLGLPKAGEQFAFEVDLDACSGCKACVTACHSLNGLDEQETWRKVGVLLGRNVKQPFQQTITTACHHCVEPGCLAGCPVEAYEKDFTTGIVRHLDDQCIGCQYCSWMCPYDVPQYSSQRGIVRKCDMCSSRLSAGEAPACVQACPNGAITIRIVNQAARAQAARRKDFLPDSPDPLLTIPTTLYRSANPLPANVKSSSSEELRVEHAHAPLIFMLVFTQMSAGLFALPWLANLFTPFPESIAKLNLLVASTSGLAGLLASVFHLGRPAQAWRSFLGWRHSWLSREVIVFGLFGAMILANLSVSFFPLPPAFAFSLSLLVALVGIGGLICSALVYHATRREFWSFRRAAGRFLGTAFVLGLAALWLETALYISPKSKVLAGLLMAATMLKLGWEVSFFKVLDADNEDLSPLQKSARLLTSKLRLVTGLRLMAAVCGGIFLPFVFLVQSTDWTIPILAFVLCVLGELAERYLFFTAVAPPKMPGGN